VRGADRPCITGTDACSGANVNIEYLLFLDLDGDGTMETVVNSQHGHRRSGLEQRAVWQQSIRRTTRAARRKFDERPVPINQKWGFSIQETVVGHEQDGLRTLEHPVAAEHIRVPELPHGTHKIKWFITDGCGNNKEYEYTFTVKDCKPPTVVCINGLSVNIMPTAMIQLWALTSCSTRKTTARLPARSRRHPQVRHRHRFPIGQPTAIRSQNVTFDCTELGTQCVELWAIDAGNADYCETYVIVQDNLGQLPSPDHINVAGALKTEFTEGVEEGTVYIDGTSTFSTMSYFDLSDTTVCTPGGEFVPLAATFTIAPEKDDNPLNGVTTYDLVLISKHILGLEPLDSPYKMIAADANKSGSITTFDIVEFGN
jgi:hypothetical protein